MSDIKSFGAPANGTQTVLLPEFRTGEPTMNMTMTVLSCRPRVFEINNFLSGIEVDHIIKLATGMDLKISQTGEGLSKTDARSVRTSRNTWVSRGDTPMIDAIYRRAADLMRIDEALFRTRVDREFPELRTRESLAEHLQLVHYGVGQVSFSG